MGYAESRAAIADSGIGPGAGPDGPVRCDAGECVRERGAAAGCARPDAADRGFRRHPLCRPAAPGRSAMAFRRYLRLVVRGAAQRLRDRGDPGLARALLRAARRDRQGAGRKRGEFFPRAGKRRGRDRPLAPAVYAA